MAGLPVVFFVLRFAPIWHRRHQGCDAYYFLMASEALRRSRRLPVVLPPVFLLEPQEQWYPPGFTVFLALLPKRVVERYYWALTTAVDAVVVLALFVWLWEVHGLGAAWLGAVAYAMSPILNEYGQLTSRSLAAVLTAVFLVASYLWIGSEGGAWALVGAIAAGVALLLTHKLSAQLLWFLCPFLAVVEQNAAWLAPLAASYGAALVIGRRQFVNILRAHWDIISFWTRNWRYNGVHAIEGSPIYGDPDAGTGFYRKDRTEALVLLVRRLLQYNLAVIAVPVIVFFYGNLTQFEYFLACYVAGTYLWAMLTLVVNPLKCFGEGTKYIKFAIPPTLVLVSGLLTEGVERSSALAVLAFVMIAQAALYCIVTVRLRAVAVGQSGILTPVLEALLRRTKERGNVRLMCLPSHLADLAAYRTGVPVLWGGHGYELRTVEEFIPVMRRRVEYFVERYGLTHLLLDRRYTSLARLDLKEAVPVDEAGDIALFAFDDLIAEDTAPS